ncbi:MAG TPA: vWA domain-containing protein [Polyangiales bacterium]|nr:vWA domain-containing protein [Polyangiales bacterium]
MNNANMAPPAGQGLDGLPSTAGSMDSHVIQTSKPSLDGTAGTGLKEGQCAKQNIVTARVVPTIWLVLDGSGSMLNPIGQMSDQSRWAALHDALMNPDTGVVKSLEKDVKWGVVLYDGPSPGGGAQPLPDGGVKMFPPAETCPRVVVVEPKKDAFMEISTVVGVDPLGGSTPTDKALEVVVGHLEDQTGQVLDARVYPTIVVLATDGEPNDFCSMVGFFDQPPDVRPKVVSAVTQLASMDIKTYVISLASEDMGLQAHLADVAKAGNTGLEPFVPTSKDALVQAFKDIIGPETACDVVLNGSVKPGLECMGTIKINGTALPCNDPNGWKLTDKSTVSIQGTACEQYKKDLNAVLEADFPCELIDLN